MTSIAEIDALAAELPAQDPDGLFHRACAQDSWCHSEQAIPLYRKALDIGGLTGENRRRAVIQMASSMRSTGQAESALKLPAAERDHGSDHLDDAQRPRTSGCRSGGNEWAARHATPPRKACDNRFRWRWSEG